MLQNGNDSVTITDFFSSTPAFQIERIEFADGTQWQPTDILNHIESGQALPTFNNERLQRSVALIKHDIVQFIGSDEEDDDSVSSVSLPLATAPSDQHRQQSSLAY